VELDVFLGMTSCSVVSMCWRCRRTSRLLYLGRRMSLMKEATCFSETSVHNRLHGVNCWKVAFLECNSW